MGVSEFKKTKLNKDIIKNINNASELNGDEVTNDAIAICRHILMILEKYDFTVYESLVLLSSLSEAIYSEAILLNDI